MNKNIVIEIIEILKKTYPDAKCSLNFTTPFEMLIAVMLSAQCTDERVNKTTPYILSLVSVPKGTLFATQLHVLILLYSRRLQKS